MIVIQIVDWRSYLGRSDMKNVTWLKLSTALIDDPRLFGLTAEQKWAWIYILNQAVTHGKSGELRTTLDRLVHFSGVNKKSLQGAVEHFVKAKLIDPVDNSAQLLEVNVQQLEVADSNFKSKKVGKKTEVIDLTDEELELGRKWLDMDVSEMPHRASDPKWHAAEFGTELKKVGQAVGLDHAGMLKVFHYVSADPFWRPNTCAYASAPGRSETHTQTNGARQCRSKSMISFSLLPRDNISIMQSMTRRCAQKLMRHTKKGVTWQQESG
jgi:hypothetical protein